MHADLLDILFENRNKAYGAYALRKNYSQRLQWALGISLSFALLLMLLTVTRESYDSRPHTRPDVVLRTIDIPKDKPKDPEPLQKKSPVAAQVKSTPIKIVPNGQVKKTEVPAIAELQDALTSTVNRNGLSPDSVKSSLSVTNESGNGNDQKNATHPDFHPTHSDAQFPGGKEAFAKFLTKNLITPDELEVGDKKIVVVRFMVDIDGSISKAETIQSDGDKYTKEVMRVLSKMPKWIPAMQNGMKVATWFTQPVTFIGIEY